MKVTTTIYLHENSLGMHICSDTDLSGRRCFEDYILLATQEVTFDVTDGLNKAALRVAAIDRQIEKMHEEYSGRLALLKDEKAKLLCLENEVPA